jgi:hypothetical protein
MKRTEIKRMLLQIKTSDANINHRFQTHWETIKPGSFTKLTLVNMCLHLGISCPTRMRKTEVFKTLIGKLLLRGGSNTVQLDRNGKSLFLNPKVVDLSIDGTDEPYKILYFNFDDAIQSTSTFTDKSENGLRLFAKLINLLNIPGYMVYFSACKMLNHKPIKIFSDFSGISVDPNNDDTMNVYKSFILTQCIWSYVKTVLGTYINEIDAVSYVISMCSRHVSIDTLFTHIYNDVNFKQAYARLEILKGTCGKSGGTCQYVGGTGAGDDAMNHSVNFIVQRPHEFFCGFVAIFTMLSKSSSLRTFITDTLVKHAAYLKTVLTSVNDRTTEVQWKTVNVALLREKIHLKYFKREMEILDGMNSFATGVDLNFKLDDIQKPYTQISKFRLDYTFEEHTTTPKENTKAQIISLFKTYIKRHIAMTEQFTILFNMRDNNLAIAESNFANRTSVCFSIHRLLNELQRLYPVILDWMPYGACRHAIYQYTMNLFMVMGVHKNDITYVYTNGSRYHETLPSKPSDPSSPKLYVHLHYQTQPYYNPLVLSHEKFLLESIDKENSSDKKKSFENLGGFVMATTPTDTYTSRHYISGFTNGQQNYIYDGSVVDNSHGPTPVLVGKDWVDIFNSSEFFIQDNAIIYVQPESDATLIREMSPRFVFPGQFVGFGVLYGDYKPPIQQEARQVTSQITSDALNLYIETVGSDDQTTKKHLDDIFANFKQLGNRLNVVDGKKITEHSALSTCIHEIVDYIFIKAYTSVLKWNNTDKDMTITADFINLVYNTEVTQLSDTHKLIYADVIISVCGMCLIQGVSHVSGHELDPSICRDDTPELRIRLHTHYNIDIINKTILHRVKPLLLAIDIYYYFLTKTPDADDELKQYVKKWLLNILSEHRFIPNDNMNNDVFVIYVNSVVELLMPIEVSDDEDD